MNRAAVSMSHGIFLSVALLPEVETAKVYRPPETRYTHDSPVPALRQLPWAAPSTIAALRCWSPTS